MTRRRFRTVFISDTHLGSRGCRADELQRFLKRVDCERLYLVGDIVDFWRIRGRIFWPGAHNDVLRRILKLASRGTRVVLIPGNHDEVLRGYVGHEFGGIAIEREAVHRCADGRRLLVVHGDEYDLVVKHSRLLSMAGGAAYEALIVVNRWYNRVRHWRGKPYWSLAQHIKLRVKGACTFLSRFEEALATAARSRGMDGVVCGHVHQPARTVLEAGIVYWNTGDWIENCTALVEDEQGRLALVNADLEPLASGGAGSPDESHESFATVVAEAPEALHLAREAAEEEDPALEAPLIRWPDPGGRCEVDWMRVDPEVHAADEPDDGPVLVGAGRDGDRR